MAYSRDAFTRDQLENRGRQDGDKTETRRRQDGDKRETRGRQEGDQRETRKRWSYGYLTNKIAGKNLREQERDGAIK